MKILVTGSSGFLGRHVMEELDQQGDGVRGLNLINTYFLPSGYDCVVHLAAKCGGIGANQKRPGEFIYDNLMMGLNIIEGCRIAKVKKLVLIGTVCSYPSETRTPFVESDLWNGYPEPTNAPYGIAKRTLFEVAKAYRAQYGLNSTCLIPANLYGPGDNFDPETSHVIPAIIRKCVEAVERGDKEITLWGTGNATREFLYVKDCARAIRLAIESHNDSEPVNIGTGESVYIHQVADIIAQITGFHGEIKYDGVKPDGQRERRLCVSGAYSFGFKASTGLIEGLIKTVDWYKKDRLVTHVDANCKGV